MNARAKERKHEKKIHNTQSPEIGVLDAEDDDRSASKAQVVPETARVARRKALNIWGTKKSPSVAGCKSPCLKSPEGRNRVVL